AEHVRQIEPEQLRLVTIEIVVELRRRRAEGREQLLRIELRLLAGFSDQRLRRLIERRAAAAGEVLDLELEAASRAEAGDRWGIEAQRDGVRDMEQLRAHRRHDVRGVLLGRALVPRLEDRELHRRVRLRRPGEGIEAADRDWK